MFPFAVSASVLIGGGGWPCRFGESLGMICDNAGRPTADVGAMVSAMAGKLFGKSTGAQVPMDGGNDRVI